jgi:hypothetical protein
MYIFCSQPEWIINEEVNEHRKNFEWLQLKLNNYLPNCITTMQILLRRTLVRLVILIIEV